MLTVRSLSAGTEKGSGSLYSSTPIGMDRESLPPKVTACAVPGTTCAPPAESPTVTAPNCTGRSPKTLLNRSSSAEPPKLVWSISRTVWWVKPRAEKSVGELVRAVGVGGCGLAAYVPT
jgi:hypothetical protein